MNINKKMLKDFDFGLLINVILICIIGIIMVSSATRAFEGGSKKLFIFQIVWVLTGLGFLAASVIIDYDIFRTYSKIIYFINVAMLAALIVIGEVRNGANSWLGIGSFGVQPSEFMKLSLIILFAKKIEDFGDELNSFKNLGILFIYAAIPLALIVKQPDLGTAMVIIVIIIGMIFMAGLDLRIFAGGILAALALALFIWFSPFQILTSVQRNRILTFFNPSLDQLGNAYHITQSLIAIGSGQLFGMGLGKGLQSEGKFLPYSYSDFIFSVLGEELGFVGAIVLILLYGSMLFKCLKISRIAKDKFGSMVVIGVMFMLGFQMFQNIGMTIQLMPITGITLPFVSYGGSSMLTSMISIGLVLNIRMRRHKIYF